jgi:hypothetical protein
MTDAPDGAEMAEDRPPLGIGFAILLGSLISVPLWGIIVWLCYLAWQSWSLAELGSIMQGNGRPILSIIFNGLAMN